MKRLSDYLSPYVRIGVGCDALVSWYNSFSDPAARMFRIAQNHYGGVVIWVMGMLGMLLILDALINDCTPDRITFGKKTFLIKWKRIFVFRHVAILALAMSYAFHPYIADKAGYPLSSAVFFYENALFIAGLAIFDAKERTRSIGWQRAFN